MRTCYLLVLILLVLCAVAPTDAQQRYAVTSGNWNSAIWAATPGGVAGSATAPTQTDDIIVETGVTVTVDVSTAECLSVLFGDTSSHLAFATGSILSVFGNFTIDTTYHSAFTSWPEGAKLRFAGSASQVISGWSLTGNSADSTTLMEIVVDKTGDTVKTPGLDMKLALGRSLEILRGNFLLAYRDDINGRIGSEAARPTIFVDTNGVFKTSGSTTHIRQGVSGTEPLGTMTVYGTASLATTSSIGISIGNVDVEGGGTLRLESFTSSYPGNVRLDTVVVKALGNLYNSSTINFWSAGTIVDLRKYGSYRATTATTNFPTTFLNNGTVRYQRTAGDGSQAIVDMDYYRLEVSFAGTKTWTLTAPRVVADSLETNNSTSFVLAAATPQTLTVNRTLRLTSGSLNNSDPNVALVMADSTVISRATGQMTAAPQFLGVVDLRYTSTVTSVSTGPEVPSDPGVVLDMSVICDTNTVTLASPITVNGTLTMSNGIINNDAETFTLASGASIRRATGTFSSAPTFAGNVNVAYVSSLSSVVTGNELPLSTTALQVMAMESPMNVTLGGPITINGELQFIEGNLYLGDNHLTLAPGAIVTGVPGDSTMIVTNGSGELRKQFTGPGAFVFPVGDSVDIDDYSPASLTFTGGVYGPAAVVGVRVTNAKHPQNTGAAALINRYWSISSGDLSGFNCNLVLTYTDGDVVEPEAAMGLMEWDGATWTQRGTVSTTTNELSGTVSAFSEFTGMPTTTTVSLFNGWNLLSVPVQAEDMRTTALFPTAATFAYAYESGYQRRDTLRHGRGYWVKFNGDQAQPLDGTPVARDTVDVFKGWNIVGPPGLPIPAGDVIPVATTLKSSFFSYDPGYNVADTLLPGKGYWIKVDANGQLILGGSGSMIPAQHPSMDDASSVTIENGTGGRQTLYFGSILPSYAELSELPPPPPSGSFDARFASGRRMELIPANASGSIYPIAVSAGSRAFTISWNLRGTEKDRIQIFAVGKNISSGSASGSAVIEAGSLSGEPVKLILSAGEEIPKEFSLGQNYPNPFNPSTSIRFGLPAAGIVSIDVFNAIGQKISTLLHGRQMGAGFHTIEWNASTVPSGMYLYRLTLVTGSGSSMTGVRRMMLLK